ncbi:adat2 [Ecytonucleospora hepatopenaei]|uniref:Adat2 n=1 Tax=Ecytonucleospora hepatopenaei TaxID=646526 RepID=A0A1W0E8U4_9MICR|nr:adat2 [Ecytonucleospora hepatopenaei]
MYEQETFEKTLELAQKAYDNDELPVGAILKVFEHSSNNNKLIFEYCAHNQTNKNKDPLSHCEKICIEKYIESREEYINKSNIIVDMDTGKEYEKLINNGDNNLTNTENNLKNDILEIYITLEPCVMCYGIIERLSKYVKHIYVYYGVKNEIFGATTVLKDIISNTNDKITFKDINDYRTVEIIKKFYSENRNERVN